MRPTTRESFVRNLRYLMSMADMSQAELSRRSKVSQKTISNILSSEKNQVPSIETADMLAKPFGLEGWHLIMPNLPEDLISSTSVERLLTSYVSSSEEGRKVIDSIAEREAEYNAHKVNGA